MSNIPWIQILSKYDSGYAFPKKSEVPSSSLFKNNPIVFCPRDDVLGYNLILKAYMGASNT